MRGKGEGVKEGEQREKGKLWTRNEYEMESKEDCCNDRSWRCAVG